MAYIFLFLQGPLRRADRECAGFSRAQSLEGNAQRSEHNPGETENYAHIGTYLAYFLEGAESSGLIYFALIVSEIMRDAIE